MDKFLEVKDLQARYDRSQVLHGISFSVREGEIITLLGRNGMGKSTSLKCVMGLLAPHAGDIRYAGQSIGGRPSFEVARLGIGLVPEGRQIFSTLTVEENLLATAANRHHAPNGFDLDRIYDFFPRLNERRGNMGNQLSGGEQQMLAIARALMSNPSLLLMDEPSVGLAPMVVQEIFEIIAELKNDGVSIFLVEQNVHMALKVADHFYLMDHGQIAFDGTPDAIAEDEMISRAYLGERR